MATWLYIEIRLRAPGLKHSLPTLYPAVHPFHPIPHAPFRSHAMFVVDSNSISNVRHKYWCLYCDEKENKDFDLI